MVEAVGTDKLPPIGLPPNPPDSKMRCIDAAIALITHNGQLLICQRKAADTFGGYWEFPGGKQEAGETLEECLQRELREELDISARPITQLTTIHHDYEHALVRLHPFVCEYVSGDIRHLECQASKWIEPRDLPQYEFPPANESLLTEAIEYFASKSATSR